MTGIHHQTVTDPYRDTDWANQGRCRGHDKPDLWFPVSYERDRAQVEEAKAECRQCPVIEACTAWAMDKKAAGIWGGLTEDERDQVAAAVKRQARRKPIEHGTYRGYSLHRGRGVPLCDPCRAANVAYEQERKAKRKEVMAS